MFSPHDPALMLRRIGVLTLAAALVGTGVLVILHLAVAHGHDGGVSHQDCKICQILSHQSAILALTCFVSGVFLSFFRETGPERKAFSPAITRPGVRAPPDRLPLS